MCFVQWASFHLGHMIWSVVKRRPTNYPSRASLRPQMPFFFFFGISTACWYLALCWAWGGILLEKSDKKTLLVHCLNILLPFPWQHWSAATWERGVMDDDRKTLGCPLVTFPMHPCFAAVSAVQCNVSGIGWYLHCNLHYGIPMHRSIAS